MLSSKKGSFILMLRGDEKHEGSNDAIAKKGFIKYFQIHSLKVSLSRVYLLLFILGKSFSNNIKNFWDVVIMLIN